MSSVRIIRFLLKWVLVGFGVAFVILALSFAWSRWADLQFFGGAKNGEAVSFADAVARAAPAVVSIHAATALTRPSNPLLNDPLFRRFFGVPSETRRQVQTSLGSGVIVDPSGYILTNNHVIANAQAIDVTLADGRVSSAKIIGADPDTDLAVLKIEFAALPTITIADSDAVRVGDVVLAIGNPAGVGQTVTQGIVSATGRNRVGINTFENFIQTDAAINPGNSGGALINAKGDLVGINSAILGYQAIGLAIPTSIAVDIMRQLITTGGVVRGWLGIEARDLTTTLKNALHSDIAQGIVVLGIIEGGPADRAGIESGDILTHIDDSPIGDSKDAVNLISRLKPGAMAVVKGVRDNTAIDFNVAVARRPNRFAKP